MPLNLISDSWIPVRDRVGTRRTIAPWQMADGGLLRPDWPRPDLNLGCLELLIGLVFLADPPEDLDEWDERQAPDPDRLRDRLAAYAPAFDLTGGGPRFLQDLEPLEGKSNSPEMLFIDSAGQKTIKNNADLMVHRSRYKMLAPDIAAMALYTLQAHAPSGGAGNRTSMRGGGPMVTLVDPGQGLWPLIWANVPCGKPADLDALPWMKPTPTSEQKGSERWPAQGHPVEAFFGMPRRLQLVEEDENIVGVIQRPYGVNYAGWVHPLTPYYRQKEGGELLPKHPRPGRFGYRNWRGVVAAVAGSGTLVQKAATVRDWSARSNNNARARLIVAGWAMDNMKPLDFSWSTPPFVNLSEDAVRFLSGLIEAADSFGLALRGALTPVLAKGEAREAVRERFFHETQSKFEDRLAELDELTEGEKQEKIARAWVNDLRQVALELFKAEALPGLADREASMQQRIVAAHRSLQAALAGYGKNGAEAYGVLGLEPVKRKKREEAA